MRLCVLKSLGAKGLLVSTLAIQFLEQILKLSCLYANYMYVDVITSARYHNHIIDIN